MYYVGPVDRFKVRSFFCCVVFACESLVLGLGLELGLAFGF